MLMLLGVCQTREGYKVEGSQHDVTYVLGVISRAFSTPEGSLSTMCVLGRMYECIAPLPPFREDLGGIYTAMGC
jgi:hypothetical protein